MKLIATMLAALVLGSVAMGSAPIDHPSTILLTPTNWSESSLAELAEIKLTFEPKYDKVYDIEFNLAPLWVRGTQELPSSSPTDFLFQWSGNRKYSVASRVVLPDFRGWKGVDGVALVGYRLEPTGDIPVFGAGLEFPYEIAIDKNLRLVLKGGFGMLFEQGQSIDRGQLRFYIGGGIRY